MESILLGIPLPPIFVAQREDGIWDVVDGLQRISTILEFAGLLKGPDGTPLRALELESTRYLPALKGKYWQEGQESLTPAQRLLIKRARLDVIIVKRESDPKSKFELFQRLNTGGTPLSDQEVRNCLMMMVNADRFRWFSSLRDETNFQEATALSERNLDEQYDLELVLRFLILRNVELGEVAAIEDLNEFLTDKMYEISESRDFDEEGERETFCDTFGLINSVAQANAFRRYDREKERFLGGFLVSAFETVALGVGHNIEHVKSMRPEGLMGRIKSIWDEPPFQTGAGAGRRASTRLQQTIPLGRSHFRE